MFNGPIDLTPYADLLKMAWPIYWSTVALAAVLVSIKVRGLAGRGLIAVVAIPLALMPPWILFHMNRQKASETSAHDQRTSLQAAFDARCKEDARVIIRKAVESVDGIIWPKWRPAMLNENDQFAPTDPYGQDCMGSECITALLRVTEGPELGRKLIQKTRGFAFVESTDEHGQGKYRYTAAVDVLRLRDQAEIDRLISIGADPQLVRKEVYGVVLRRRPVQAYSARYSVDWTDISTREDRMKWIAGGALTVIDQSSGEIIAERRGFILDLGQGNTKNYRSPWSWARIHGPHCPANAATRSEDFVWSVLAPATPK